MTSREGRTAQALELEGLDVLDDILKLVRREVVVLDEVDDVGEGEHAGKAVRARVVERCRDDAWEG